MVSSISRHVNLWGLIGSFVRDNISNEKSQFKGMYWHLPPTTYHLPSVDHILCCVFQLNFFLSFPNYFLYTSVSRILMPRLYPNVPQRQNNPFTQDQREGTHWDGIHMYKMYQCQRRLTEKHPGVCWAALMEIPVAYHKVSWQVLLSHPFLWTTLGRIEDGPWFIISENG